MEAKLFWISMASGAYALLLRWFFKKEERLENWRLAAVMHGLFWAITGVVAGSLASSYWERPDLSWKLMTGLGAGGFLLGAAWRWFKDRSEKGAAEVLYDDLEWADTGFSSILLAIASSAKA